MFDRNAIPTTRDPPGEAEKAYVRALLWPLEQKFESVKPKPKRIFPRRVPARVTDHQLLASYRLMGPTGVLPMRLLQARMAAAVEA